MQIKITDANEIKIEAVLSEINGNAVSHTASHHQIFRLAAAMEARLDALGIPKKERAGATATGMSGGTVPRAYKWQRTVNRYKIERKSADWFLTFIGRVDIYGNALTDCLMLLPIQKEIAVAKFVAQFSVQQVVALAAAA